MYKPQFFLHLLLEVTGTVRTSSMFPAVSSELDQATQQLSHHADNHAALHTVNGHRTNRKFLLHPVLSSTQCQQVKSTFTVKW